MPTPGQDYLAFSDQPSVNNSAEYEERQDDFEQDVGAGDLGDVEVAE